MVALQRTIRRNLQNYTAKRAGEGEVTDFGEEEAKVLAIRGRIWDVVNGRRSIRHSPVSPN